MEKILFSTDRVGILIDTKEWNVGPRLVFFYKLDYKIECLLTVSILCLHLDIAILIGKKKGNKQ